MTIPQKKRKVKQKKRSQRKKLQVSQKAPIRKKKAKKRPLVTITKRKKKTKKRLTAREQLTAVKRELAAAKRKLKAARIQPPTEAGAILSPRSEAARKGWTTRRHNIALKRAQQIDSAIGIVSAGDLKDPEVVKRYEHLKQPHVAKQIQNRLLEKMPEFFVRGTDYFERPEPNIMVRLIIAEQEGDFDDVAKEMAEEYGYEDNEIYSLWHGYSLDDAA